MLVAKERLRRKGINVEGPTESATGAATGSSTGAASGASGGRGGDSGKISQGHWKWILNSHGGHTIHRAEAFKSMVFTMLLSQRRRSSKGEIFAHV